MMRDHARIEELLAVRSLGALDGEDVRVLRDELASHGDCEECRRLATEFEEVAGRLAFALEPEAAETTATDVLRLALASEGASVGIAEVPAVVADELADRRARRAPVGWRALAGIAAALALVIAGFVAFGVDRSIEVRGAGLTQTVIHFEGQGGELAMAYTPGRAGAVLVGSGFADPGADKVYELWTITGQTPVSQGCVTPTDGAIATRVASDVSTADLMAVTVESSSCPSAPTTQPFLTASLTS
jgi:hypothetical protein